MFVNPSVNPSINQSSNRSINRSVTRSIKRSIIGNPWGISGDFWLGIHSLGEVQIQTEHIHTHAIFLTKPRFPVSHHKRLHHFRTSRKHTWHITDCQMALTDVWTTPCRIVLNSFHVDHLSQTSLRPACGGTMEEKTR